MGIVRTALIIIAMIIGLWIVGASGLARTIQTSAPERALALWPWNAVAAAQQGQLQAARSDRTSASIADAYAQRALRNDPSQALAYAVLASTADTKGDPDRARRLFNASAGLSRRLLLAQLWLIEDAVRRGQVGDALDHYVAYL